jgi:hypothetical protein
MKCSICGNHGWNYLTNKLPKHHETVLVYSKKGFCVVVFIDSVEMNKELVVKGYPDEQVDVNKKPYYFCSQEIKGYTLNGTIKWMSLPDVENMDH